MTAPFVWVVDASVAAQVVSPEPLTAQAMALFALLSGWQATFHVPDLFYTDRLYFSASQVRPTE